MTRILLADDEEAIRLVMGRQLRRAGCRSSHGVPEEYVDRILDPFFTTNEADKGTGLGLSISHNILTRFKGTLKYRTEGGAVFTVTLPAMFLSEE